MDTNETLKINVLLERVANLSAGYENQIADLRVQLHQTTVAFDELNKRVKERNAPEEEESTD